MPKNALIALKELCNDTGDNLPKINPTIIMYKPWDLERLGLTEKDLWKIVDGGKRRYDKA